MKIAKSSWNILTVFKLKQAFGKVSSVCIYNKTSLFLMNLYSKSNKLHLHCLLRLK